MIPTIASILAVIGLSHILSGIAKAKARKEQLKGLR